MEMCIQYIFNDVCLRSMIAQCTCIAAFRIVKVTDSGDLTGERADGERPTGGWPPYVRGTAHSGVTAQRGSVSQKKAYVPTAFNSTGF